MEYKQMKNINTIDYWNQRFSSENWGKSGSNQTIEYAKENSEHITLDPSFRGSILDFGCALGDAIPIYKRKFPNAKFYGYDHSDVAIQTAIKKYGDLAEFYSGTIESIRDVDIIIASHVMEHLSNDIEIVQKLLNKCQQLFIYVPYKEWPLYHEHVNTYDENYYKNLDVINWKIFTVRYMTSLSITSSIKIFLKKRKIKRNKIHKREIIMFQAQGSN